MSLLKYLLINFCLKKKDNFKVLFEYVIICTFKNKYTQSVAFSGDFLKLTLESVDRKAAHAHFYL